jgi:uncharacterized protein (TIGR02246 family)
MNNSRSVSLFTVIIVLMSVACLGFNSEKAGMSNTRNAVEKANAKFSEAFERGDSAALAALYTQDAIVFPPGSEMVKGRQAIEEFWKATRQSGVKSVTLTTVDVGESGDLAYEVGTVLLTIQPEGKKPATASAKYVVVWKRQIDGSWQLHRDIWNQLPPVK